MVIETPDQASKALKRTLGRLGMGPAVSVPMAVGGRPFGGLAAGRQSGSSPFSKADVHIIEAHAVQAAIALEFARVRNEPWRAVLSDERRRVGSELHGRVIQILFGAGLAVQSAAGSTRDEGLRDSLQSAVDAIDRAIEDLRRYVFDLGPTTPMERGLDAELRSVTTNLVADSRVELTIDIDPSVPAMVSRWRGELLQVVREAIANVVQHAEATRCVVRLSNEDGNVVVEVSDDGMGLPTKAPRTGYGLANLHARAAALGGWVAITPNLPSGTTVTLTVPTDKALVTTAAAPARQ
jgi:signal transduction histidine kinase